MNSMGTWSGGAVRSDARFIGDLVGSYVLASRAQHAAGLKVFACRARSITTREVVLMAPVIGQVGEAVSVAFQDLGIIRGVVARQLDGGFAVEIRCTEAERATLSGRIQWLKRKVARAVDDRREHRRVLPREPRATLMLESGPVECLIIDMSRSGVACLPTSWCRWARPCRWARCMDGSCATSRRALPCSSTNCRRSTSWRCC